MEGTLQLQNNPTLQTPNSGIVSQNLFLPLALITLSIYSIQHTSSPRLIRLLIQWRYILSSISLERLSRGAV